MKKICCKKREKKYAQKIPGRGGEASGQRARRGEDTAGKKTSKIAVQKILLLMAARKPVLYVHMYSVSSKSVPGVIGVNKRTLGLGVVIVLVVILLGLPGSVHSHGVGAVLSAAWDVVTTQDPETSEWSHI